MLTGALLAGQAGVPTEELHLHPQHVLVIKPAA
jgi:hypothetical protein